MGVTVAKCLVGNNHLSICFHAKSPRLEQWLFVPDTSCVNIVFCFDIIDGIHDEVEAFPEGIVKNYFSFRGYYCSVSLNFETRVETASNLTSSLRL